MKRNFVFAIVLIIGILVGAGGGQLLRAQAIPLKPTDLLKTDVADFNGIEVLVTQVEFAPGATSGRHMHPGQEVAYVLDGSGVLEVEGQATSVREVGSVSYIPARTIHESKNVSTTKPMKILVFRIHPKGQPVTIRLTEPSFVK